MDNGIQLEPPRCPHALRADVQPPPKFMRDLPIDKRGYPVPWFVDWFNGEPEFRAMDMKKFVAATNNRLCWTCGQPLFGEEVFVIGPMCAVNRISSEPPSHRECAVYAATNCPFLSKPQMVRREGGLPGPKQPTGGVMVERNPGVTLLWYTKRHRMLETPERPGICAAGVLFQIGRPFKVEWYKRGRPATRAEVEEAMESGLPILRETSMKWDGPAAMPILEANILKAQKYFPRE